MLRRRPQTLAAFLAGIALVPLVLAPPSPAAATPRVSPPALQARTQFPLPQRPPVDYPPDRSDPNAAECDRLVDSPADPEAIGGGSDIDQIDFQAALSICEQAAARRPLRPRYEYLYGRVLLAAKRYEEAARQYMLAESAGYALADFSLAFLYETGTGMPRDFPTAAALYQRAAAAGYADALAAQGMLLLKSATPNYPAARGLFERAVQAGSLHGKIDLGMLYEHGNGVPVDIVKAANLYTEAAMAGNAEAMYRLGMITRYSDAVQKDPALACKWFQGAYENNHPYGTLELGNCYYSGQGMNQNRPRAFALYHQAAQAGLPLAQTFVAAMLQNGDGAMPNEQLSTSWYRQAALQNEPYAMTQLGVDLRLGRGVSWSEAQAMQWFHKAAGWGNTDAMTALGVGYMDGLGQDAGQGRQDYQQAAAWFGKAAAKGDGFAQINLGMLYEGGRGVPQDADRARQLYTQASGNAVQQIADLGKRRSAAVPDMPRQTQQASTPAQPRTLPAQSSTESSDFWKAMAGAGVIVGSAALLSNLTSGSGAASSASAGRFTLPLTDAAGDFRQAQRNACAATLDTNCRDVFGNKW